MIRKTGFLRAANACAVILVALCVALDQHVIADDEAADDVEAKPKVTFAPEVEKKFSEVIEKTGEAKKKIWADQARKEIDEIVKMTGLGSEGVKALEKAAASVADKCIGPWKKQMETTWRSNYAQQTDESMPQILEQATSMTEEYARYNWFDHVQPTDDPSWSDAVRKTLSPEQFTTWEKDTNGRKQELQKKITDFLKPLGGRTEEQYRQTYLQKGAEVNRSLGLSKDISKQVDAVAESVAKSAMENWRKRAERLIRNADEQQRRQMFKEGNMYIGLDQKEMTRLQQAWRKGVDGVLPVEAVERMKADRANRRTRETQAWSQILIAELDRRVAFTAAQRESLRPIVERLIASSSLFGSEDSDAAENGIPLNPLYTAGSAATDADLQPILDEGQCKRWKDTCRNRGGDTSGARFIVRNSNVQEDEEKQSLPPPEPEEIEGLLSDYLVNKASAERARALNAMLLKTEDAARVAKLSPTAIDRLRTAARGATEQSLAEWKAGLREGVRPYANGGTVQMVNQRLANIQDYRLQRTVPTPPEQQPVWDETVKAELTPDQFKAWQVEISERDKYRDTAIAAGLLEAFEYKVRLTQSQLEKLKPMLAKMMADYAEDIRGMFSSSMNWYLQRYYMFLPFAGIPEKEMKEILTKEQWETWTGCQEFNNANSFWENVKRMHDQRSKNSK